MRHSIMTASAGVCLVWLAIAQGVAAPSLDTGELLDTDRLDLSFTPSADGLSAGQLCARGNVGTQPIDNCIQVGPKKLTVTNPPMGREFEVSSDGPKLTWQETYGPRAANASLGTGSLTANFNKHGRLTGVNWPNPSFYDHVNYLNITREYPNFGAMQNAGSFGGVDGHWLIDKQGWHFVSQRYADSNTETLITKLERDNGLQVTITDVVAPDADILARNYKFSRPVDNFAYYANMNPTTSRAPRVNSVTDAFLDPASDFATAYDAADGAMLHFRPAKADPASASTLLTSQPSAENAQAALTGSFGEGVYIAVAGQGQPTSYQAGQDTLGLIRSEAEGTSLLDPFYDYANDTSLSNALFAAGKTAGGLAGLPADDDGSYTVYLSAAHTPTEALARIEQARESGFQAIRTASEKDWRDWLSRARLPATDDAQTLAVSKRALMAIRTARDRNSGAIMANTTPQTPYRQDWVRDGAFFNYALLLAGYNTMAREHSLFYNDVYRPGGTWDSFYYADGAEASAVFPYEIDAQGAAIWGLWLPYALAGADDEYLEKVYPAIEDTANALLACTDPSSGLQCPAPEDDSVQPSQGAQGASGVYLGYRSAVKAARALGKKPNPAWAERADELRMATLEQLCNDQECPGGRGAIYLSWPSRLLNPDATPDLLQSHYTQFVTRLDKRSQFDAPEIGKFFQYPMESLMALGLDWRNDNREARLDGWIKWLTHDVAEPGVDHYAERIYRDGERSYLHTVGFPHIWSGAETYIAAAHVYGLEGCASGREKVGDADCVSANRQTPAGDDDNTDSSNNDQSGSPDDERDSSSADSDRDHESGADDDGSSTNDTASNTDATDPGSGSSGSDAPDGSRDTDENATDSDTDNNASDSGNDSQPSSTDDDSAQSNLSEQPSLGSGAGCSMVANAPFDPLFGLLVMAAGLVLRRRRRA